ncbi:SUKH-3 domain-containing protein [Tundrisphaera lichenicola]|uniref:SUKH-3 domain-containing protein n=1 Tax=Tundrisphaera lichenicola TaxID=2029860 RepID=UPI003EBDA3A2
MNNLSDKAREIIVKSGWFEGRDVNFSLKLTQLEVFPAALEILKEFYGLHIGECGAGIDMATCDILINPNFAIHLQQELEAYAKLHQKRFFPLGEVHRDDGYMIIDDSGIIYLLSDILEPFASNFYIALELLLLGRKPSTKDLDEIAFPEGPVA